MRISTEQKTPTYEWKQDKYAFEKWLELDTAEEIPPLKTRLLRALKYCMEHDLTERQREVLLLQLEYGNMRDVADILGVNVSTVCRTLTRAKKRIMERIKYVDPVIYEGSFKSKKYFGKVKRK